MFAHASANYGLYSPADIEIASHSHETRFGAGAQIVQNSIHRALIEDPIVAKAPQIELKTLQLNADIARDIYDIDEPEVGSASPKERQFGRVAFNATDGAQRRKFRAD